MNLPNEKLLVRVDGTYRRATLILSQYESLFCVREKNKAAYVKMREYPFYVTIYKNGASDFFNLLAGEEAQGDCSYVFFKCKESARKYADSIEAENPEVYAGITEIYDFSAAGKKLYKKINQ